MAGDTVSIVVDRVSSALGHGCALRGKDVPATLSGWFEASLEEADRCEAANERSKLPFGSVRWNSLLVEGEEVFAVAHATASGRLDIRAAEKADGSGEIVLTAWAGPRWSQRPHVGEGEVKSAQLGALRLHGLYWFQDEYYLVHGIWEGGEKASFIRPDQAEEYGPDSVLQMEYGDLVNPALARWQGAKVGDSADLVDTGVTIPPRYRPPVAAPEPVARIVVRIRPEGGYHGGGLFEAINPVLIVEKPERILLMGDTCRRARIPLSGKAEQAFRAAEGVIWTRQAADAALLAALPPQGEDRGV